MYNLAIKRNADIVLCQHGTITTDGIITRKGQSGGFIWGGIYRRDIFEHMRFPKNYWYEDMINGFLMKPQANQILEVKETLYYKETSAHNASKILWHNDNIKAIDQWYLTKSLVHSYYKLGLKDDELVFKLALNECSALMVSRIGGIDPALQMQVFMACSRFLAYTRNVFIYHQVKSDFIWPLKVRIFRFGSYWRNVKILLLLVL